MSAIFFAVSAVLWSVLFVVMKETGSTDTEGFRFVFLMATLSLATWAILRKLDEKRPPE